jgi:YQGE family putative transporter
MWQQGGSLGAVSRFNFAVAFFTAIAFLTLAPLVKRGRSVIAVRVGLLFQVGFFLSVLALGTRAGHFLEFLGALNGMGMGSFWVGQNMLIQQAIEPEQRPRYWGYVSACWSATALVGPFTGSRLVAGLGEVTGYRVIFSLAACGYAVAALLSAGLATRGSDQPYRLVDGLVDRFAGHPWRRVLAAHIVSGFRDSILSFLPSLLVFMVTGDAKIMGNFSLVTSAVGLVTNTLTGRLLPRARWRTSMLLSGCAQAGAALLMLANLSLATLLLYSLVVALVGPLLGVPLLTHSFDTIGAGGSDSQVERIVWRELCLVTGRCTGMILMLLLSANLSQNQTAMIILAAVAAAAVGPALILRRTLPQGAVR